MGGVREPTMQLVVALRILSRLMMLLTARVFVRLEGEKYTNAIQSYISLHVEKTVRKFATVQDLC